MTSPCQSSIRSTLIGSNSGLHITGSLCGNQILFEGVYNQVSTGDVGYISEGALIRMFNVTLSWDDESNRTLGEPCHYDRLRSGDFAIRDATFDKVDHYSSRVLREEVVDDTQDWSPGQCHSES